jgi:hypothetical protein
MHEISREQSTKKYLQRSLMAYLDGEQNLSWILGIIGSDRMPEPDLLNWRDTVTPSAIESFPMA